MVIKKGSDLGLDLDSDSITFNYVILGKALSRVPHLKDRNTELTSKLLRQYLAKKKNTVYYSAVLDT